MNREQHDVAEPTATYELHFSGPLPASLRDAFPEARVSTTPAQTILLREVTAGTELDVLLDQLFFMGLVLSEVHERPSTPPLLSDADTPFPYTSVSR